ncbi:MAG TPA: hypothetical protein VLA92_04770 [Candidatus Saccharimonadales bacterium]|nr:hypothetical protein [Candidatus Saccharimonadales bacterium]
MFTSLHFAAKLVQNRRSVYPSGDKQDLHIARFRAEHSPDVILADDNLFDYEPVITQLQSKLATRR